MDEEHRSLERAQHGLPSSCSAVCNRSDYINTLTNFSQTERPPPVRGGILADDM